MIFERSRRYELRRHDVTDQDVTTMQRSDVGALRQHGTTGRYGDTTRRGDTTT